MPGEETELLNNGTSSILPSSLLRIYGCLLDVVEILFEVIFLICCAHLNSDYEVSPPSPLD